MLTNFHTHTSFSDGDNSAEEVVLSAIAKGFSALGISDHAFTEYDLSYCLTNEELYINQINTLKEKYKSKIQLYLGVEEDAFSKVERRKYDYIIGSCHYVFKNGQYHSVDSSEEGFKKVLTLFNNNPILYAENYYLNFVNYINERKPDIIGHFDLITKYDEIMPLFFNNKEYEALAKKYLLQAIKSEAVFEVNTGAISRGIRTTPYPSLELLHTLKKQGGKVILSSDSHNKATLDSNFNIAKDILKEVGFNMVYSYNNDTFVSHVL